MFTIHADLKKTNELLERIVEALERAHPVAATARPAHRIEPQDIRRVDIHGQNKIMENLRRMGGE